MVSTLVAIIVILVILAILVLIGWLSFSFQIAMGQTIAPPNETKPIGTPPAVVSPPNPTPTAPNPNFQYLPQKAFVYSYAPENGATPTALTPLPAGTPIQTTAVPVVQQTATGSAPQAPFDIMAILATVGAAGAYLKGHLANNKANKVEGVAKETMGATLNSKEAIEQLAKLLYEKDPEWASKITNAPAVRLSKLSEDKEEFANKAATS